MHKILIVDDEPSVRDSLRKIFQKDYQVILEALKKSNYVQSKAAGLLGVTRRIPKYKMDKYGIVETPGS